MPLFRRTRQPAVRRREAREVRREWARRQLRRIAILPSLMTLLNGICGVAAIHVVTGRLPVPAPTTLLGVASDAFVLSGVLIVLAMIADMLDGRIARFTRQTTDFGGQLDSLCDVVSFGVAPAIIVYHLTVDLGAVGDGFGGPLLGQFAWLAGAGYFSCAALRLARFNVENVHDESAHLWFKGLPSPGAAAAVVALLLIRTALGRLEAPTWAFHVLAAAVPAVTLSLGLLMVSRYRYPHFVNQYLHRRQSFAYLARVTLLMFGLLAVVMLTSIEYAAAAAVLYYVFGSAAAGVWRQVNGQPVAPPAGPPPSETPAPGQPPAGEDTAAGTSGDGRGTAA
jgi:CDP-diacylglycerol--serine O-phosphatidyltransferase